MRSSSGSGSAAAPIDQRILDAAFAAFTREGYAGTSTLDIARRAKVSKRDLYAAFGNKHAVLAACIKRRAERMRLLPELPSPQSRAMLARTLTVFATNLLREISDPMVIAAFRLAIAEASRAPEIAQTLEAAGRDGARRALAGLLARAQASGLLGGGDPSDMVAEFFGLLWEGLLVGMLLGVAPAPEPDAAARRAEKATKAFLRLYPDPADLR